MRRTIIQSAIAMTICLACSLVTAQDNSQIRDAGNLRWRDISREEELTTDPDFVPMPVTGEALKKEQDRVKRMLEAQK
jgi:hypothetical protein